MVHANRFLRAIVISGVLAIAGPALAQDEASSAAGSGDPAADIAAVIDEISATRSETQGRIEELGKELEKVTNDIQNANAIFDEMIATLRDQAALGDPGGSFVERIETLEALARKDAEEAKLAGYSDLEELFLEDAGTFADQKRTATSEYEALDRRIRGIEAERERVVFLIKLRRYDEAQELVDNGLGELRDADTRLGEIESVLRETQGDPAIVD